MKHLIVLLTLSSIIGSATLKPALAQSSNPVKLNGQVVKADSKPVEFATITLLKAKDSSLVKGAIADVNGRYEFENIKQGRYLVAAAYVGMARAYGKPFEVNGEPVNLGSITLEADTKNLKEVNVTAKKPFIEQRADKMVVNVENSIVAAGGTAMEVLEKSPGITVDKDDNISLKGKNGVIIMIDGKLTNMSPQDVAQLLKNMPSNNIEQIELIANPSAKYDAAGNAGIINIKLKKNRSYGTNGNLNLGFAQGRSSKYNGGLNLNHRAAKVNLFGSYNYNHRANDQRLGLYRTGTNKGELNVFDQYNFMKNKSDYHSAKAGADFFVSKNHTVGVMVDASFNTWGSPGTATTLIGNGQRVDSTLITRTQNASKWDRWAYNVNYKGVLDSSGKELNVDLDYARNTSRQNANIFASTFEGNNKGYLRGDTSRNLQPSTIDIKTIKADYSNPLKNQAKLEAGFKVSFVESDNDARFDSLRNTNWVYDANRSNHFIYKENINAGYINFNKQFKKVGVQLGLRGEQTHVKGTSVTLNTINDTTYFNLFPSVFVSYAAGKNHQLGISYSRRIQRPSYEDLNPFEFYLDRYTKASGNPYLRPQYSNNFEITHTFKQFLITSVGYSHTKDMITQMLEADRDAVTGDTIVMKYKYLNVAKSDNFNLNISVPMPITKWWTSFTNLSGNYSKYQTVVNNSLVNVNAAGFFGRTQHTFTLPKGFSTELVFFYMSPQISQEGLFKMKAMYALDWGISKSVLNKKGTLKLNVSDVFNNQRFQGTFDNAGYYTRVSSKWESQQVRLNFTYRFGNTNVKAARNRKTGLEDEQNRVKGGGN
ncbi:Outer membrane receptor proteins, mostly Fe transport [Chitinophaga rupis]|uniref:Outer membrane receptor proteins, mostly Fe transport n=1 Tax=Chitinophaga rupis TaxID=573321 RepID=A0A1H7XRS5_9BACT|nr:TonB-dependent receptor [Chitinophaga rupis]SEM35888.1 Outer membrane receptor proteins, mostly Fe transport [Chitinophaga rupis]